MPPLGPVHRAHPHGDHGRLAANVVEHCFVCSGGRLHPDHVRQVLAETSLVELLERDLARDRRQRTLREDRQRPGRVYVGQLSTQVGVRSHDAVDVPDAFTRRLRSGRRRAGVDAGGLCRFGRTTPGRRPCRFGGATASGLGWRGGLGWRRGRFELIMQPFKHRMSECVGQRGSDPCSCLDARLGQQILRVGGGEVVYRRPKPLERVIASGHCRLVIRSRASRSPVGSRACARRPGRALRRRALGGRAPAATTLPVVAVMALERSLEPRDPLLERGAIAVALDLGPELDPLLSRLDAEGRVCLPPVDPHLLGALNRRDQEPDLDRDQLDVEQVDLDVAGDDDALVEHALEDVGEVRRLLRRVQLGGAVALPESPALGYRRTEVAAGGSGLWPCQSSLSAWFR